MPVDDDRTTPEAASKDRRSEEKVVMSTHSIIHRTLLTAFVLSMTSLASAHAFPRPPSKAESRAEQNLNCKIGTNAAPGAKRVAWRFGPPSYLTTGTGYRVAAPYRFGAPASVRVVSCTRPMRAHVACL